MAAPTRNQIEAAVTLPTFAVEVRPVSTWTAISADVLGIQSGTPTPVTAQGLEFGTAGGASASVAFDAAQLGAAWAGVPIRISYGFGASSLVRQFVGYIVGRSRSADAGSYECRGVDWRIESADIRSPLFYRRPIATRTTLVSLEDPTNANYAAGLYNYICWQAGGRPFEQAVTYPSAEWYYQADDALIAPEWTWIAGEDAWAELDRLCKAAGGWVYQTPEGVLRYASPLSVIPSSSTYLYTGADLTEAQRIAQNASGFTDIRDSGDAAGTVTGVTCTYVERVIAGTQEVYRDTRARRLAPTGAAGDDISVTLDLTAPIFTLDRVEVDAYAERTAVTLTSSQVTVAVTERTAQRVTATVTNTTANPAAVFAARAFGRPVVAGEEGSAAHVVGDTRVMQAPASPLIQSASHAEALCRMLYDVRSVARPIVTLSGCAYDPDRQPGERVDLTWAPWGLSATPHLIVDIRPDAGETMEVDLLPIAGLPTVGDFFIIGTTYLSGDSRELSY